MSKELNVKMELWKKAHELEAKAMETADLQACNEAAEWKGKLSMAILQEEKAQEPVQSLAKGFIAGNGVKGCLSHIGADEVTGDAEE